MTLDPAPILDDPFLQIMASDPIAVHRHGSATLVEHAHRRGIGLVALGEPAVVAALISEHAGAEHPSVTIPRGTWDFLPPRIQETLNLSRTEEWNWLEIDQVPTVENLGGVRELNLPSELRELTRVRDEAIPRSFLTPTTAGSRWFGWFDAPGALRAIGGALGGESGVWPLGAHLGSIGTLPQWQGRGVGAAITAGMVQLAFNEGARSASLGVYVKNQRAIKLYQRLGFVTKHCLQSRNRAE